MQLLEGRRRGKEGQGCVAEDGEGVQYLWQASPVSVSPGARSRWSVGPEEVCHRVHHHCSRGGLAEVRQ